MKYSLRISSQDLNAYWGWMLVWGICFIALGCFAVSAAVATTLISVFLLGIVIMIGGIFGLIDAFTFWWGKWTGFTVHLLVGLLYFVVGLMVLNHPVSASISLTLLLGIFYILIGTFRIAYSFALQMPRWGWGLANGIVSLLVGLLILVNWPASSLIIIGLFVGIDLIFLGWAYTMAAVAAKNAA